ncbi:MAG TPA: response regulator [Bryobacteraceae bacterium]|nr:response regulator [Bryobacteraceae bacterium]
MGLRILIVEDEQIIAADLAIQLARMHHEVLGIAISGEEAIELADQTNPQLVLMDIQLEGEMTGTEAARAIQERTGAQLIFVTAFPGEFSRGSAQIPEPRVCLNKPFSRLQLAAAVQAACGAGLPPDK